MDSEKALMQQAAAIKAASPHARVFVYRNSVHAMPWFRSVREKLLDPQYADFFLRFAAQPPPGGFSSPPCDSAQRCSSLYHDQTQTPSPLPSGDGVCTDDGCDCGSGLPCGMYLFNHANGSMIRVRQIPALLVFPPGCHDSRSCGRMQDWLISEYFVGSTSAGSDLVSGLFIDDYWCAVEGGPCPLRSGNRLVGPAETERHVLADLGMSEAEVNTMAKAWRQNMDHVYTAVAAASATTWDLSFSNSYNVPDAGAMTVPRPTVIWQGTCEAVLSKECGPPPPIGVPQPTLDADASKPCCCATAACPVACPAHCPLFREIPLFYGLNYTSKNALSSPQVASRLPHLQQDLAGFLLIRGDWAWLGFGFASCHNDTNYTQPHEVSED